MKEKLVNCTVFCGLIAFLFLLITFSSCTKDSDNTTKEGTTNEDVSDISEFTESDDDLLSVDFNYFYNELTPHGEWIEVTAADLGLEMKKGKEQGSFLNDFIGVKNAYALDVDFGSFFVWRPGPELSVSFTAGEPAQYTPYNNGQWINTDAGWYFKSNSPQEDLTCHYGRWTQDPILGWVWLPGKVWAPAWVEWRENDDYVAWAPVPPGIYIQNDAINVTSLNENRFTIVEKRQFIEPSVYKYRYQYVENKNKIMIKEMTKTDGIMIKNKTVINKGPEVSVIEEKSGKKIEQVKIKKTGKKDESGYAQDVISVYNPEFKKEKEVKKEPVSKPEKLVSYKDAKKITKEEKEELKEKDKTMKKEEKEMKKEDKEKKKDDKDMKKEEKENKKENKDKKDKEDKEKGNKNSGDDVKKTDKVKDSKGKGKN